MYQNGQPEPRTFEWKDTLAFSQGVVASTCVDTIRQLIPGCASVATVGGLDPRQALGVDYVAQLRGGAEIFIDHKRRDAGASRYWKEGPDLALELWSVRPDPGLGKAGKVGWTIDESKASDLILFDFDRSDSFDVFLVPFQHLRMAFRARWCDWKSYKHGVQITTRDGRAWSSECVFVPASEVLDAVYNMMWSRVGD